MADFNLPKTKKQNNRTKGVAKAAKVQRRKEAEERNAKYQALPLEQKLAQNSPNGKVAKKLLAKAKK